MRVRAGSPARLVEGVVEPEDVAVEEAVEIFGAGIDARLPENLTHQRGVRAAGEVDPVEIG